jgi:DNA-binding XRE family transcriptional regulator
MKFKKGALNVIDEETLCDYAMVPPVKRPSAAKPSSNPIARFREELRLTVREFAKLVGVPFETARSWERAGPKGFMPVYRTTMRMIGIARKNKYPLLLAEIYEHHDREPRDV